MGIRLGEEVLDIERTNSILFFGENRDTAVKNFFSQLSDSDANTVIHLQNNNTAGGVISSNTCETLCKALKSQANFRYKLLVDYETNNVNKLNDTTVSAYLVDEHLYMPDDIVCIQKNGEQLFFLAKDYFTESNSCAKITKYIPKRTYLLIDDNIEFLDYKSMDMIYDVLHDILLYGTVLAQTVVFSVNSLSKINCYTLKMIKLIIYASSDNDEFEKYVSMFGNIFHQLRM